VTCDCVMLTSVVPWLGEIEGICSTNSLLREETQSVVGLLQELGEEVWLYDRQRSAGMCYVHHVRALDKNHFFVFVVLCHVTSVLVHC